jgi:hypothetical protein
MAASPLEVAVQLMVQSAAARQPKLVMPGLVPGIHVLTV